MNAELIRVREEIRLADEALVRELAGLPEDGAGPWEARAAAQPAYRIRVELGLKVAETKFRLSPARYRPLALAGDDRGLEQAITDAKTEAAVLDRVRQAALACGCAEATAERIADLYRRRVIPETKSVQVRRLRAMVR